MRTWQHLLVLLLVSCAASWVDAQTYQVAFVTAQCKNAKTKQVYRLGDQLTIGDGIDLGGQHGRLLLWNLEEGFTLLTAKRLPTGKWQTTGTVSQLKEKVQAPVTYGKSVASLADLQHHFDNRKYLILDKTWLLVAPGFNLRGDTILFFKFETLQADAEVSRKVEHRGDSLILTAKSVLDMNGKPVAANDARNFYLYWLDMRNKGYSALAHFEFVFADENTLVPEVKSLLGMLAAAEITDGGAQRAAILQFLAAVYGNPDPHNFDLWVAKHFSL